MRTRATHGMGDDEEETEFVSGRRSFDENQARKTSSLVQNDAVSVQDRFLEKVANRSVELVAASEQERRSRAVERFIRRRRGFVLDPSRWAARYRRVRIVVYRRCEERVPRSQAGPREDESSEEDESSVRLSPRPTGEPKSELDERVRLSTVAPCDVEALLERAEPTSERSLALIMTLGPIVTRPVARHAREAHGHVKSSAAVERAGKVGRLTALSPDRLGHVSSDSFALFRRCAMRCICRSSLVTTLYKERCNHDISKDDLSTVSTSLSDKSSSGNRRCDPPSRAVSRARRGDPSLSS